MSDKIQGPKSYFPSIETKYGHPIDYWMALLEANVLDATHMNQVAWLKENHEVGHGHANALVAVFRRDRGL